MSFNTFRAPSGRHEHYVSCEAPAELGFAQQVDVVARQYAEALQSLRLPPESAVFRRIYVSDAANQAEVLRRSSLVEEPLDSPVAVSLVQQPPLPTGKLAMLAYHVDSPEPLRKTQLSPGNLLVEHGDLGHLWSTRLCAEGAGLPVSTAAQTRTIFDRLIGALAGQGGTLAENCVRTWIYVKDVDVFYQDMVDERIAVFAEHGLTQDTHYIASTGIEGACAHRYDTVLMDAYSVLGLRAEQVAYLTDFDLLCATKDYNVTFERGTRIGWRDRAHHFISGTASIDHRGQVVHPGDVRRQLDRTLENVEGLLRSGGAGLEHMTHLVAYLRDPADFPQIRDVLSERFGGVPLLVLRAPVCRPEWLVEVEGIAIAPHEAPALPEF